MRSTDRLASPMAGEDPDRAETGGEEQRERPRPFRRHPRAERHPCPEAIRRAERGSQAWPSPGTVDRTHPFSVEDQEQDAGGDERGQEDVEHRDPALHDVETVEREEHCGNTRPPDRAPQAESDEVEESHSQDPEDRRRQPPTDRPVPERADSEQRDDRLASWRMHPCALIGDLHRGRSLDGLPDPAAQVSLGVVHVVLLIPVEAGRRRDAPQPHPRRRGYNDERDNPARPARRTRHRYESCHGRSGDHGNEVSGFRTEEQPQFATFAACVRVRIALPRPAVRSSGWSGRLRRVMT